ncbi:hypothetical protein ABPG74_014296 [Tetrahymena malaccensis]
MIVDDQKLQSNWYNRQIHPQNKIVKAHLNSIETLSVNIANPTQFATGSHDHLVKLWDLNTFKNTSTLQGHKEGIWSTQYSLDGKSLLTASPDKSLIIWDLSKGKPASVLKEHHNKVYFCQYNEDNKLIASGGEDSRLIIWDTRKGTPLKIIQSENKIIYNIKWSRCGNYLVTSEFGGVCKIFETRNFSQIASFGKFQEDERAWCCDIDFRETSKHKNKIFVGYESRIVKVLTFSPQEKSLQLDYEFIAHMDPIKCLNLDGQKELIITSCRDGSARIWESYRRPQEYSPKAIGTLLEHDDNVSSIQFVPHASKTLLLTSSYDCSVNFYQI